MSYIPDNYDLWAHNDAEKERQLQKLPKCCICGEPIQQEQAVYDDGDWYCEDCEDEFWQKIRNDFLENTEVGRE